MGAKVGADRTGTGGPLLSFWLWDLFFAAATVFTCALIALEDVAPAARFAAMAIVVGMALSWPLAGRRMALSPDARPFTAGRLALCAALGVGMVAATALADSASWAAFIVYSQLFWLLPLGPAIGAVVALTVLGPLAGAVFRGKGLIGELFPPQAVFMSLFGILVGVFITRLADESERRAALIAELEASQAQVAELSHVAGAAAERERLAGEIHDTLAQGFTSIVTLLQAAQAQFATDPDSSRRHVELAVRAARENLQEARRLVAAGAPGEAAARSLADAVGRTADRYAEETGSPARHTVHSTPRKVSAETEIVLLRAAQELLANARKHAGAGRVEVDLDYTDPDAVALAVSDDGPGFDPDDVDDTSFGLRILRGRVERLTGAVDVDSGPSGTTVTVTVPTARTPQEIQ
ncbi:sensor histidine kinase [Pseudonocardia humida]|uniref:Oxygen sensor histidine kinase NreB n=1 Tax=Pseudonocardia humida TaxID=2800819 RepID=A0ABT1A2T9_9PSEU|nr:ATP-binding protein [Pseudonocardia humida]MCO1657258.1 sensor histidine kinase [Pseudonocardia humida]